MTLIDTATSDPNDAARLSIRTAYEHMAFGRAKSARREIARAARLVEASTLHPSFARGVGGLRQRIERMIP